VPHHEFNSGIAVLDGAIREASGGKRRTQAKGRLEWATRHFRSHSTCSLRWGFEQALYDCVQVPNVLNNGVDLVLKAFLLFQGRQRLVALKLSQALDLSVLRFPYFLKSGLLGHYVISVTFVAA
jgi:hypothetical protein